LVWENREARDGRWKCRCCRDNRNCWEFRKSDTVEGERIDANHVRKYRGDSREKRDWKKPFEDFVDNEKDDTPNDGDKLGDRH
jgi:hypothetical protein